MNYVIISALCETNLLRQIENNVSHEKKSMEDY
jgi:hypothetical protein